MNGRAIRRDKDHAIFALCDKQSIAICHREHILSCRSDIIVKRAPPTRGFQNSL